MKRDEWKSYVLGLTIINDVTDRDLQFSEGQWTVGKGIDTFCPMGPWIDTDLDSFDLEDLGIKGTSPTRARPPRIRILGQAR